MRGQKGMAVILLVALLLLGFSPPAFPAQERAHGVAPPGPQHYGREAVAQEPSRRRVRAILLLLLIAMAYEEPSTPGRRGPRLQLPAGK